MRLFYALQFTYGARFHTPVTLLGTWLRGHCRPLARLRLCTTGAVVHNTQNETAVALRAPSGLCRADHPGSQYAVRQRHGACMGCRDTQNQML